MDDRRMYLVNYPDGMTYEGQLKDRKWHGTSSQPMPEHDRAHERTDVRRWSECASWYLRLCGVVA